MRRSIGIVLLSLYALSSTECHQVMKLPLLVSHYQEHSQRIDLSFLEFLVMHYETDVAHDDTDMKLPFKECGHSQVAQSVAFIEPRVQVKAPSWVETTVYPEFYQPIFTSGLSFDIFQPPRLMTA